MELNRNTLSAIKLFQLFGGSLSDPLALGISDESLQSLIDLEVIERRDKGYALSPLPHFFLPPPYNELTQLLPFDNGSFFKKECVVSLGSILRERRIETVVELGCWKGISTIFMAIFLPLHGKVYAVDHWKGSAEHTQDCSMLYPQFLSNVIRTRLTDQIIPLKMTTLEASRLSLPSIDLIYVDASHDEDSVYQDLNAWYPHVQLSGGILCGDDYLWGEEMGFPVQKALKRFAKERSLTFDTHKNFWKISSV